MGVTSLSAGAIWWRWYAGQPQLQLRDAEWLQPGSIPWSELDPAPKVGSVYERYPAQIPHATDLAVLASVVVWNGGLFLTGSTSKPVRGIAPYGI